MFDKVNIPMRALTSANFFRNFPRHAKRQYSMCDLNFTYCVFTLWDRAPVQKQRIRDQSHCRDSGIGEFNTANNTFTVYFLGHSWWILPILAQRFWKAQNIRGRWAIDLHNTQAYAILIVTANYTFFVIRRVSRNSVTGPLGYCILMGHANLGFVCTKQLDWV